MFELPDIKPEEVIIYLEKRLHFKFNEVTHENDEN